MKKNLIVLFAVFATSLLFAQKTGNFTPETSANNKGYDETTTQIIIPENQHTTDETAEVRIEYTPMYGEARIYYTCMYVTYDKGQAMNTVIAILEDFMKENQYYHYTYMARDKEKYYKDDRGYSVAQYMSYVKFTR